MFFLHCIAFYFQKHFPYICKVIFSNSPKNVIVILPIKHLRLLTTFSNTFNFNILIMPIHVYMWPLHLLGLILLCFTIYLCFIVDVFHPFGDIYFWLQSVIFEAVVKGFVFLSSLHQVIGRNCKLVIHDPTVLKALITCKKFSWSNL